MKLESNMAHVQQRISDITSRLNQYNQVKTPAQNQPATESVAQLKPAIKEDSPEQKAMDDVRRYSGGGMRFSAELEQIILQRSRKHGVSPDLVRAVIRAESGGKVDAKSRAGALGLMQLMPQTAKGLGVNPLKAGENVDGGVRYLKSMAGRFGGDLDKTLAAYNAGPGAVDKHKGVPPYPETQNYVRKIRRYIEEQQPVAGRVDIRQ